MGFGTFGAAGMVRWLDAEVFDIRWLGERTFASTTDEAETQQNPSGTPMIGIIGFYQRFRESKLNYGYNETSRNPQS